MREIKFRVWDNGRKKMITSGIEFELARMNADVVDINDDIGFNGYGDRFDIMQFTGIKDKNRKEMYEGDIVKYKYPDYPLNRGPLFICKIEYDEDDCSFVAVNGEIGGERIHQDIVIEVIGNIHESPELLGKVGV